MRGRTARRVWTRSSTWFPGSKRVAKEKVTPAREIYNSEVKVFFVIRDAKTNAVVMKCEGYDARINRSRKDLYEWLCMLFFRDLIIKVTKQTEKNDAPS